MSSINNPRQTSLDRIVAKRIRPLLRPVLLTAALLPLFVLTYYLAYWLRFEGQLGAMQLNWFTHTVLWIVIVKVAVFAWFRVDRSWGRFVTFYDLVTLVQAATFSLLLMVLIDRFFLAQQTIPRSVFMLDWGSTIVMLGGVRALSRTLRERNWISGFFASTKTPVLIVGANDAGEALLRSIRCDGKMGYHVAGFIDGDPRRLGSCIAGVPVIGLLDQTCRLAERHAVTEVLIATEELSGREIRTLVDEARQHSIHVKVLPSYEQLISGRVATQPRPVSINDLLRREPVQLDLENIRQWIDNRILLVTGSAGSIGSEICRQLLQFSPKRLIAVDRSENGQFFLDRELRQQASHVDLDIRIADILDEKRMHSLLDECQPDIIFHAAAYKHVPLMECHPGEAVKNIVQATRQLADLARDCGVKSFVLISTDKAVNPTSVMGTCKRAAELYVQSQAELSPCRFVTVRFGNVLDSAGSVVRVFRQQIAQGGPVTVTDPRIERFFMTIPEAARLVIQAGAIGRSGEILSLDMGDPVRIVDLAGDMIRLSGLKLGQDIEIEFIGLRPGEKLFEELHVHGEKPLPTLHPKIRVADRTRRDASEVLRSIEQLVQLADEYPESIVEMLKQIVPEYNRFHHASRVSSARLSATALAEQPTADVAVQ